MPQVRRGPVDQRLDGQDRDGMADAAILRNRHLVLEDDPRAGPVVSDRVRPAGNVEHLVGFDRAGPRVRGIGAAADQVLDLERREPAVLIHREPPPHNVVPRVNIGNEGFQAVGPVADRTGEQHRERRHGELVPVVMALDPVPATDVVSDHPDVAFLEPEMAREQDLGHVRRLSAVMERQPAVAGVVVGDDRAGFRRHAGMASEAEFAFDHPVGRIESGGGGAVLDEALVEPVGPERGMEDGRPVVERRLDVGDGGKFFPLDAHMLRRVLGPRPAFGDDGDGRLALPARAIDRHAVLQRGDQRRRVLHRPQPGQRPLGKLGAGENRDDAGPGLGLAGFDRPDAGVRVGAADEGDVDQPLEAEIGDVASASEAARRAFGRGRDRPIADSVTRRLRGPPGCARA